MLSNRSGNSGLYFRVLKFDSEYGLSLEVYGRLCVLVTAEVGEQELHRLGALRRAAVGVQRQHLGGDLLLLGRLLDQRLGQLSVLPVLDRPADDVAAEQVEDHVQVVVRPLGRTLELAEANRPLEGGARSCAAPRS
jgi:hypothetical protein